MADHTLFVGLDVHKRTIAVATAPDTAGTSCTYYGTIANTPDALRRLCKKLAAAGEGLTTRCMVDWRSTVWPRPRTSHQW